jgi:hypothetical protein
MSRAKPWFQFNSDAFLSATIGWPGDLKGFYCLVIVLMDARGGKLPDDLKMFARATGYEPRKCRRLLEDLSCRGKLRFDEGFWSLNPRLADVQSAFAASKSLKNNKPASKNRSEENISSVKKSLKKTSLQKKSAGARAGEMETPARPAPSEQKPTDTDKDRAAFVRKILGREVKPGRLERPELNQLLDDDLTKR